VDKMLTVGVAANIINEPINNKLRVIADFFIVFVKQLKYN
jgi:hypothetical protein